MFSLRILLAVPLLGAGLMAAAPFYSASSIVNSADGQPGELAPNTIATVYGTALAWGTKALTPEDVRAGVLPTTLPGTGVRVLIGGLPANLYYVSPTQINFLVPVNLLPGKSDFQIVVDALWGPLVPIQIAPAAPAMFQADLQTPIATHVDGSLVTSGNPAQPGSYVILFATGLGQTSPPCVYGQLPTQAAPLRQLAGFRIWLDGNAVDPPAIAYAGIAPGFAGLYQINLRIPDGASANPEIRIGFDDAPSIAGLRLPLQP